VGIDFCCCVCVIAMNSFKIKCGQLLKERLGINTPGKIHNYYLVLDTDTIKCGRIFYLLRTSWSVDVNWHSDWCERHLEVISVL